MEHSPNLEATWVVHTSGTADPKRRNPADKVRKKRQH